MSEDAEKTTAEAKRQRQGRSPAYPGLPLKQALEKAKAQYDAEGKYPIPMTSAYAAWGYGAKSSGAREVRATLRYYGLITIEGDGDTGKIKLTDDALRVILDEREDQTEKRAIIRRLAMNPPIHKKLVEQFPEGIKSAATVAHFLMFEAGFNKSAADALITEFKATASYAGLYEPDNVTDIAGSDEKPDDQSDNDPGNDVDGSDRDERKPPPPKGQVRVMEGERVAFTEESQPGQYLKLIASGDVDDFMLEALEDYVKRQRKRLAAAGEKAN